MSPSRQEDDAMSLSGQTSDREYRVVMGNFADSFAKDVNELLDDGWSLQGGVSVAIDHGGFQESALVGGGLIATRSAVFAQAMVREGKA